jgi:hypothetical protein
LSDVSRSRIAVELAAVPALPVKLVCRKNFPLTPSTERFVERVVATGREAAKRMSAWNRRRAEGRAE